MAKEKRPIPFAVSIEGLAAGQSPTVAVRYRIDENREALEAMLGDAFRQAEAASTDGAITVEYV